MFKKIATKSLKYIILLSILIFLSIMWITHISGNFYTIEKNIAYRSGKLMSYNLNYYLDNKNIQTVLNLRGFVDSDWYKMQRSVTKARDINMIDYEISGRKELSYEQMEEIIQIIKNAKKPILIHCLGGADRTSLVAALYEYAIKHKSKEEALKQLSFLYGHFTLFREDYKAMDRSFEKYIQESLKRETR